MDSRYERASVMHLSKNIPHLIVRNEVLLILQADGLKARKEM